MKYKCFKFVETVFRDAKISETVSFLFCKQFRQPNYILIYSYCGPIAIDKSRQMFRGGLILIKVRKE